MVSLILLVVVGVGLYTRTDHFHSWARQRILGALQSLIHGEVSLERVSGSLWSGLSLHDLVVRQNGVEVIRVPQGSVSLDTVAQVESYFRSASVHINAITLVDPVIVLQQESDGTWTIARLVATSDSSSAKPSSVSFFVDYIQITNGYIQIAQANGTTTQVAALSLAGHIAIQSAGSRFRLSTLAFGLERPGIPNLQWDGGVTYDTTDPPARLALHDVDLRTAQSHIRVSGTMKDLAAPVVEATANVQRLALVDLQAVSPTIPLRQDLTGTMTATGPLSELRIAATAQAPDGGITTQLTANLAHTPVRYEGTLEVQQLNIPKVMQLATSSGVVSGSSTFAGAGAVLENANFEVTIDNLHVGQQAIGTVTTSGQVQNQHVRMKGTTQGALGNVNWQGEIGLQQPLSYDLTLTSRNLHLAQLMTQPPAVPVLLNIDAQLRGSGTDWQTLNSAVVATLLPSRVGDLTGVQGKLDGSVSNGGITLNTLSLVAQNTTLTAQGKIAGLQASDRSALTYSLHSKNITPWLAIAGQSGGGAVRVQGRVAGALDAMQVTGSVNLTNVHVANNTLQDGSITYSGTGVGSPQPRGQATVVMRQMNAGLQWQTARLDASMTGAQPLTLQIDFTGQDAAQRRQRIKTRVQYAPERIEAVIQEAAMQLPTGVWRTSQPARLVVQNQAVHIERLQVQRGEHAITMNGTLAPRGTQDFRLDISRLPLAEIQTLLGTEPQVGGSLSATLSIQGTADQPRINAEMTTSELSFAKQTYAGLTATANYQGSPLQLSVVLRQDDTHQLSVAGGIPLALSWTDAKVRNVFGEADFRVVSQGLSLAFLEQWSPEVKDVQGILQADARVRGPLSTLALSGSAQLLGGQVVIPRLGVQVTEVKVETLLNTNAVQVSALHLRSGAGTITGSGTIALGNDGNATSDLTLRAEKFQVAHTNQYEAAMSGRVRAFGSLQQPVLNGQLTVEDTTVRPAMTLLQNSPTPPDPTITVVWQKDEPRPAPAVPSQGTTKPPAGTSEAGAGDRPSATLYERLALDLQVKIPQNTWVQVEDGSIELRGDIHISKMAYESVVMVGTLESVRGWYSFRGRKFRLQRGYVYFTGTTPVDPSLDVVLRHTVRDYRVDVVVGGTTRVPQLTLRSEPPLEQADVLSLLMFGKTTSGLTSGEKVSLQNQALQTAAGYIANDLRQSLAKELGIDNLELDVGQTLNKSRIGAGTYVREGVYVSTSQQLSDASQREFAVEYSLSENWQVKASTTTRGDDSIDIIWQKRY